MTEPKDSLSERELEILRLVATGAANKDIARQLVISPNTVKVHLRNIFAKIGVASRTEATLYAISIGLVNSAAARSETPPEVSAQSLEIVEQNPLAESTAQPAAPVRNRIIWQISLAGLAILFLAAIAGAGLRLFSPPAPAPTAAAQAERSASPGTRWSDKAGLPSPRKGMGAAGYENAFYIFAGQTAQGVDGTVLRYKLDENAWETLADKPTAVTGIQAALLGEKIYLPGGCLEDGSATNVLEVYDPRQNTWEEKAPLPKPVCAYALAAYEGQLYLFGGKRGSEYLSEVFIYDPQEDRWQERQPLSTPRAYAAAVEAGGKILVMGGYDGKNALSINEAYYPSRETDGEKAWEELSPLPGARYAMGVAHLAGLVYLLGGAGSQGISADLPALQYHIQTDRWFEFESAPEPAGESPAVLPAGNFLYVIGGETQTGLSASHQAYQAIYTISVPVISGDN